MTFFDNLTLSLPSHNPGKDFWHGIGRMGGGRRTEEGGRREGGARTERGGRM